MPYDLIVIGAGPGGYAAAIRAAQKGMKTALFESREVGGTCLNRGCIPTKSLLHSAELFREVNSCLETGIFSGGVGFDFGKMHQRKLEVVFQLRLGVESLIKANKIDLIREKAVIEQAGRVRAGGEGYECGNILVATGSKPSLPGIDGIHGENIFTSDDLLEGGAKFYNSLIIIGGGVIGMEFASLYSALGCEVTIIEAMDRILPVMDREIAQNLSVLLKKRGVQIFAGTKVMSLEGGSEAACVFEQKGESRRVTAQAILVATGRTGNLDGLCAEGVDLKPERGLIPAGAGGETCVKGIYAAGDVRTGAVQLAHFAMADGINAVDAMCGEPPSHDLDLVPACIYTSPEIACIGLTAEEAKERGLSVKTGKFIMTANAKTAIEGGERGFIKVVTEAESGRVLGAQLLCYRATDMISELTGAIAAGLTARQMASVIRPHPTFSEGVSEAFDDVFGLSLHTAPKKRL